MLLVRNKKIVHFLYNCHKKHHHCCYGNDDDLFMADMLPPPPVSPTFYFTKRFNFQFSDILNSVRPQVGRDLSQV
jgi:hypothetical protein